MSDNPPLLVVCDTSGSMNEGGKRMLVRNLLTYLQQVIRICPSVPPTGSLKVIAWGEASEVVVMENEIFPFMCVGRASVDSLTNLMSFHLKNVSRSRLLLISDGQWQREELSRMVQWRRTLSNVAVRVIATGSDANRQHLLQLAGASAVFNPEEIVAALHSWDVADPTLLNVESRVLSSVEMGGSS